MPTQPRPAKFPGAIRFKSSAQISYLLNPVAVIHSRAPYDPDSKSASTGSWPAPGTAACGISPTGAAKPLPRVMLFTERGRALAVALRGPPDAQLGQAARPDRGCHARHRGEAVSPSRSRPPCSPYAARSVGSRGREGIGGGHRPELGAGRSMGMRIKERTFVLRSTGPADATPSDLALAEADFDRFVQAVSTFEDHQARRSLSNSRRGVAQGWFACRSGHPGDVEHYCQAAWDRYRRDGCRSCRWSRLWVVPLGRHSLAAAVTSDLLRGDGTVQLQWRQSYSLSSVGDDRPRPSLPPCTRNECARCSRRGYAGPDDVSRSETSRSRARASGS
jgi:hypothetical protein